MKKKFPLAAVLIPAGLLLLAAIVLLLVHVLRRPQISVVPAEPDPGFTSDPDLPDILPGHYSSPVPVEGGSTEDYFTYFRGSRRLLLEFTPDAYNLISVSSYEGNTCVFSYRFRYYDDGRIDCIIRYDGRGNEVVRRDFSYGENGLSKECKYLPDGSFTVTDLDPNGQYDDHTDVNGHYAEFVNWPIAGYQIEGYTLTIWDESLELDSADAADRPILRLEFGYDGIPVAYTYLWRDEIGVYGSDYRQSAEEMHYRGADGTWPHYRTDLTIYDLDGEYLGYAQRWGDETEWEAYIWD